MTSVHFKPVSGNAKTGPIPVTTTPSETCPPACPLIDAGCYAATGHIGMHWRKVSAGRQANMVPWSDLCRIIAKMRPKQVWRSSQAGDLPGKGNSIDRGSVESLTTANNSRPGILYTHKPVRAADIAGDRKLAKVLARRNRSIIAKANRNGLIINLSGNNPNHADKLAQLGIAPVVTLLPAKAPVKSFSPVGIPILKCPATFLESVQCSNCGNGKPLCAIAGRQFIVGFPAHGAQSAAADMVARNV